MEMDGQRVKEGRLEKKYWVGETRTQRRYFRSSIGVRDFVCDGYLWSPVHYGINCRDRKWWDFRLLASTVTSYGRIGWEAVPGVSFELCMGDSELSTVSLLHNHKSFYIGGVITTIPKPRQKKKWVGCIKKGIKLCPPSTKKINMVPHDGIRRNNNIRECPNSA